MIRLPIFSRSRHCLAALILSTLPALATPTAGADGPAPAATPATEADTSPATEAVPEPTPTVESVHEYMEVNGLRGKVAAGVKEMKGVVFTTADRLLPSSNLNPAQIDIAGKLRAKMESIVESEMSWAKKENAYTEIYRATYTQSDIDALIAFCTSPIGKVYLTKDPAVSKEAKRALDQRTAALNDQITIILNEGTDEVLRARAASEKK